MVARRLEQGEASRLDIELETVNLAQAEARLPELEARTRQSLYRLDILTGQIPGSLSKKLEAVADLPAISDAVPIGLTSNLLLRRPDVRAAEAGFVIAESDRGLAELERLPRFTLFANAGNETTDLSNFFDPASFVGTLAALASWTLFDGGEGSARRASAEAASDQAALAYRKAVLTALEEVETNAARFVEAAQETSRLEEAEFATERLAAFETRRLEQDIANLVDRDRAELVAIEARLRVQQAHARTLINLVALQKSLGGTWTTLEPDEVPVPHPRNNR